MSAEWKCEGCGNINTRKECVRCGVERVEAVVFLGSSLERPTERLCPVDGTPLTAEGWCREGNGFPGTMSCPFACPICRQTLDWSGGCLACHGSATSADRDTWTFPGDRYETHDEQGQPIGDGQHWILQARGPRPACSPAQNAEAAQMLARVLGALELRSRSVARPVESGRL